MSKYLTVALGTVIGLAAWTYVIAPMMAPRA